MAKNQTFNMLSILSIATILSSFDITCKDLNI